jgi:hypothetical protein
VSKILSICNPNSQKEYIIGTPPLRLIDPCQKPLYVENNELHQDNFADNPRVAIHPIPGSRPECLETACQTKPAESTVAAAANASLLRTVTPKPNDRYN